MVRCLTSACPAPSRGGSGSPRWRTLACHLLVVVGLVASLGMAWVPAEAAAPSATAHAARSSAPAVRHELPRLRTRYSRSFAMPDGQVRQEIYQAPVNYRGEHGRWHEIDSSLVPTDLAGYAAQNAANDFDVYIPSDIDSKPLRVQGRTGWVTLSPALATGGAQLSRTSASFASTRSSTGFDYEVTSTGLKETVTLDRAPAEVPTYDYRLGLAPGLTPTLTAGGDVVVSGADGSVLYTIPAPFMADSSGSGSTTAAVSPNVTTTLKETGKGWTLAETPDFGWLNDPARVYPVRIDPSVLTTNDSGSHDCWIGNAATTAHHCVDGDAGNNYLWAGTDDNTFATVRRALLKFNLSSLPDDAVVTGADLELYLDSTQSRTSAGGDYDLKKMTNGWSDNATWLQRSAGVSWTKNGGDYDTTNLDVLHLTGGTSGFKTWSVPSTLVQSWLATPSSNYGVMVKQDAGEVQNNELAFFSGSSGSANSGKFPELVVTYYEPPTSPSGVGVTPCGATCQVTRSLTPYLQAVATTPIGGNLTYTFQVAKAGSTQVLASGTGSATSGQVAQWMVPTGVLTDSTNYQFRAQATDSQGHASGWGGWYAFSTKLVPPTMPSGLSVAPCAGTCSSLVAQSLTPSLLATATDPDSEDTTYTFQVRDPASGQQVATGTTTRTSGQQAAWAPPSGALNDDTSYEFRVQAADDYSASAWTAWTPFFVRVDGPVAPGDLRVTPCLPPSPGDGCGQPSVVQTLTPSLTAKSSDEYGSVITYNFKLLSPSGSQIASGSVNGPQNTEVSWPIPGGTLVDGANYKFQVQAVDDRGIATAWSPLIPFWVRLGEPDAPSGLDVTPCFGTCSPAVVSSVTPTLRATSQDPYQDALTYTFQVRPAGGTGMGTQYTAQGASGSPVSVSVDPGTLEDGTDYEFRVQATDYLARDGVPADDVPLTSEWSAWKAFSTHAQAPGTPTGLTVAPCAGTCSSLVTTSLTPSLGATSTTPFAGDLTYSFEVRKANDSSSVTSGSVTAAPGDPASFAVASGLLDDDTSYQFRVEASDGLLTSAWTDWKTFSTNTDRPPAAPTHLGEEPCKPSLCTATPPVVDTSSPTLSATLDDPDTALSALFGDFEIREVGTTTNLAVGSAQPDTTTGVASFTVPGGLLIDGSHYEFRVGDRDATSTTWSDWAPFDVALDKTATVPTVGMSPCLGTCSSWVTDTTTPNFTAQSADSDDSTIGYHFEIQKADGTAVVTGKIADVTPGQSVVWKTPVGNLGAGAYQIRVGAADDVQEGSNAISWTGFMPFVVQNPVTTPTDITSCPAITTHVTWTKADSPYILHCGEVIKSGGDLEIQPGTVVKVAGGSIDVQDGQLDAHGSSDYPIFFTSYADDAQMGDTNGDGSATTPAPGDWATAITIGDIGDRNAAASTAESTIKNVAFLYGGRNGGGFGGGCHGAGQVIKVDSWGRVLVAHDDFAQLECNAFSVDEQSDGIGSTVIRNSFVEPTVGYAAFDQVMSGVIKDNVLDSYATLDTWTGSNSWALTMTGNYMVGNMRVESSGAPPDVLGIHDNNLFMNGTVQEPWGVADMDLRENWWGFVPTPPEQVGTYDGRAYGCATRTVPAINGYGFNFCAVAGLPGQTDWLEPNQGFANQILPALGGPPPLPDAGLEAAPATLEEIDPGGLYGTGSEFAQRGSGNQDDPVNSLDGSYTETDGDAKVANVGYPLSQQRTYNSLDTKSGPLGKGWSWTYEANLSVSGNAATFTSGDGQRVTFTQKDGSWVGGRGVTVELSQSGSSYQLLTRAGVTYTFDANGVLQSIMDRNGQGVTLTHSGGHVVAASSSGRSITFTWTGDLLTRATLDDSRYVQYSYTGGLLTGVRDLGGSTTSYDYDANDRLHTETNASGVTTLTLGYDSTTGRVSDETDASNHHTTFAWDPVELASTVTDPAGGRWIDDYNPDGTIFARVDPKGRCTFYTYDKDLQLTAMTTPRGEEATYKYSPEGDMVSSRNQNGLVTTTYNAQHLPTKTTDAKGTTSDYEYDGNGNLLTATVTTYKQNAAGGQVPDEVRSTSFTYNADGQVKTATDARGYTTTDAYNGHGDLTDITTPEGRHTHYGYDATGRLITAVDPRGYDTGNAPADYTTTITYTDRDQVKKTTDPLGDATTNSYDPETGRLVSVTDAKNHTTSYTYYPDGHIDTVTAPGSPASVTTYTYDADNNVATVTDPDNRTVTYHYDGANEMTSQDTPLGTYTYGYDNDGRVTSAKRPGDTGATTLQFNNHGDLVAVNYPVGQTHTTYTYDIHGDRTNMANYSASGAPIASGTYTYDDFDELTQAAITIHGPTATTTDNYGYTYDRTGNVASTTSPGGSRSYAYDHDGLLTGVHKATDATTPDDLVDYTYTSAGEPRTATAIDGSHQTFGYDTAGRLTSHTDLTSAGQTLVDDSYSLDEVGNPTSITHHTSAGDQTDTYTYDARDQLTGVCYDTTTCTGATDYVSWQYDPSGNRTQETRPAGTTTYAYDATTGQLTGTSGPGGSRSFNYDSQGELTSDGTTGYTYNPDGTVATQTTAAVTTSYSYDGDGRRLVAQDGTTGAADTITREAWDPQTYQLAAEFDGANSLLRDYSNGLGPVGYSTTTGTGSNYTFHNDAQGSVVAVTGPDGGVDATSVYEPYGVVKDHQVLDASAPASPIGWAGQYTDPDGQSNLRARLYDPTTGSFHAPDPAQATAASATYTYGNANPMVNADPTGLFSASSAWNTIKAAAADPGGFITTAVGNAAQSLGLCHGSKGACGAAILHTAFKITVAVVAVVAITIATDGIGDAFLASAADEAITTGIEGELAGEVALDTNPIISAMTEGGVADVDKALAGRAPVLSPQAFSEATVRNSAEDVMKFLTDRGGRIGPQATREGIAALRGQAASLGRTLSEGDAAVLHSALQDGLGIITNDVRFARFLQAIGHPVEGY